MVNAVKVRLPNTMWMQVHWLLLALSQDQTKDKHVEVFRDQCERAALNGRWVSETPLAPHPCSHALNPLHSLTTVTPVTCSHSLALAHNCPSCCYNNPTHASSR